MDGVRLVCRPMAEREEAHPILWNCDQHWPISKVIRRCVKQSLRITRITNHLCSRSRPSLLSGTADAGSASPIQTQDGTWPCAAQLATTSDEKLWCGSSRRSHLQCTSVISVSAWHVAGQNALWRRAFGPDARDVYETSPQSRPGV